MDILEQKRNVFDTLPISFFNCLSSGSNNQDYSGCLLTIYHLYDREITYRISRDQVKDALAIYLAERHVSCLDDTVYTSYGDAANAIIRKFCQKEVGWLEEVIDDATYEKHIIMTEQCVLLADFLQRMMESEREEFSSYIFNVRNILNNPDQWREHPYINGLREVYRNSKGLSKSLKRLSTYIRKIIQKMAAEGTFSGVTDNLLDYCNGDFIREYARLTQQQNIHLYRSAIRARLQDIEHDPAQRSSIITDCCREEKLGLVQGIEKVDEMIQMILQFFSEDYDQIMRDIKHKINIYLQLAIGRARFIQNRDRNDKGRVEQFIRTVTQEMEILDWNADLPDDMLPMFQLQNHEFIDLDSIRYPSKENMIRNASYDDAIIELTQIDIDKTMDMLRYESENPYAKEKVKAFLDQKMGERTRLSIDELPMANKQDVLNVLAAVAYGTENGFEIVADEGYIETQTMLIRRFTVRRKS